MKFEKMTKAQIVKKVESIPADMLNSAVTAIRYSNPLNVISTNRVNVYIRSNQVTKIEFQSRATKQNMIAVYTEILDRIAVYYGIEEVHNIEAEYTPAWWEDDTAPAEDPEAVTMAPAEAAMHAATVRGIIRRKGGYRERDILNRPHTVERGETWNEAHKVVEILATTPDSDGYRPGCAVDVVTRAIVG